MSRSPGQVMVPASGSTRTCAKNAGSLSGTSTPVHFSAEKSTSPTVPSSNNTAKEIAANRFVTIASADIIQQALKLGLVDEICISQVPVLFGSGIRYFGQLVGHVMLEDPVVVQGRRALHLRYPVRH